MPKYLKGWGRTSCGDWPRSPGRARPGSRSRPLRGQLPAGITHLRINGAGVSWEGVDHGHGRLRERRLALEVSGKSFPQQRISLQSFEVGA